MSRELQSILQFRGSWTNGIRGGGVTRYTISLSENPLIDGDVCEIIINPLSEDVNESNCNLFPLTR